MDTKMCFVFLLSCLAATTFGKSLHKDKGPLNEAIFEMHPRLAFLGRVNGKSFYIERTNTNQINARTNCRNMGMELARLDSQSEINSVAALLPNDVAWAWTDGTVRTSGTTAFQWSDGSSVVNSSRANGVDGYVGLLLYKYSSGDSGYYIVRGEETTCYLCYL